MLPRRSTTSSCSSKASESVSTGGESAAKRTDQGSAGATAKGRELLHTAAPLPAPAAKKRSAYASPARSTRSPCRRATPAAHRALRAPTRLPTEMSMPPAKSCTTTSACGVPAQCGDAPAGQ